MLPMKERNWSPGALLVGMQIVAAPLENSLAALQNVKT